jgi:hypothetical protein
MRPFIIFLLSGLSVLGANSGISVVTIATTNAAMMRIDTKDVFTRNGKTNLVRRTSTKAGEQCVCAHFFYYDGVLVGNYIRTAGSSGFANEAGSKYALSFDFESSNSIIRNVVISTKDGTVLDAFSCTNGIIWPLNNDDIQKANEMGAEMKQLFGGTVGGAGIVSKDLIKEESVTKTNRK